MPTQFAGNGRIHVEFEEFIGTKTIEISFATSILLTGIQFEMPFNRAAQVVDVHILEQGIQYLNKWTAIFPLVIFQKD